MFCHWRDRASFAGGLEGYLHHVACEMQASVHEEGAGIMMWHGVATRFCGDFTTI